MLDARCQRSEDRGQRTDVIRQRSRLRQGYGVASRSQMSEFRVRQAFNTIEQPALSGVEWAEHRIINTNRSHQSCRSTVNFVSSSMTIAALRKALDSNRPF